MDWVAVSGLIAMMVVCLVVFYGLRLGWTTYGEWEKQSEERVKRYHDRPRDTDALSSILKGTSHMRKLLLDQLVSKFCRLSGKWAVVVHIPNDMSPHQIADSTPFIDARDDYKAILEGQMFFICDSREKCYEIFDSFGRAVRHEIQVYTVNPDGITQDENC